MAIVLPHHTLLYRAVGMCMIGFSVDVIDLESLLREAGAPNSIVNQVGEMKKRVNEERKNFKHTAETKAKISAAQTSLRTALIWMPYQDEILVELMMTHPKGLGRAMDWVVQQVASMWTTIPEGETNFEQLVDWKKVQEDPLYVSILNELSDANVSLSRFCVL